MFLPIYINLGFCRIYGNWQYDARMLKWNELEKYTSRQSLEKTGHGTILLSRLKKIMQNKNNCMSNVNDKLIKMQIRGHKKMELLKNICFEKILFFSSFDYTTIFLEFSINNWRFKGFSFHFIQSEALSFLVREHSWITW